MSSDESTETDEDDAGSLDSRDIGPIRLDESVCPKGCDKHLYDYTFELRNSRHELEKDCKEHLKSIEQLNKDKESAMKKMKKYEANLKQSKDNLEEFQRERQQRMNEIQVLCLLTLSQLLHFDPQHLGDKILGNVLIFSRPVYKKLFARVNELKIETLQQQAQHR